MVYPSVNATNSINTINSINSPLLYMKITRFEEIQAWQEARILVQMVYDAVKTNNDFQKDFRLVNQIQSASVSAMSNIAEGFSRKGNKEFIQFLFIAKSSAAEVQSQLYVALDQNYISQASFRPDLQPSRKSFQIYVRLHQIPEIQTITTNLTNPIDFTNPRTQRTRINPTNPINAINSTNSTNPLTQ